MRRFLVTLSLSLTIVAVPAISATAAANAAGQATAVQVNNGPKHTWNWGL